MFVGRKKELSLLEESYLSSKSEIFTVYGRRRIGKSTLIEIFARQKPNFFSFEGIEGQNSSFQIKHFTEMLKKQLQDPLLSSIQFQSWDAVFTYVSERLMTKTRPNEKIIFFLDEIQWMAAGRSSFISLLKYYWDNYWKKSNVLMILCGSIASFMVNKVVHSKALYGRIDHEILLKGLHPFEAKAFFADKHKSTEEILKYYLILGTIPKYLEYINPSRSFQWNMNKLFFSSHGSMINEIKKIFYSQFKESTIYFDIVKLLKSGPLALSEICTRLKIKSGGGLKRYLTNLENAEIIRSHVPFNRKANSRLKKYVLSDEYLNFYFKYLEPNLRIIEESESEKLFETLTKNSFDVWLGFAFEKFCIKHNSWLADLMGFKDDVLIASPYFERKDQRFQIDLVYLRADKVITICEIKHHTKPLSSKQIGEMQRKLQCLKIPNGYSIETALISLYGPDKALNDSNYFDHYVSMDAIF